MSFTSARRDLSLVAGARAISWLGDEAALVALTLRLQGEGRGAGAVALLLIANLLPIVLLSGVVGRALDRYDNRILLTVSAGGQAVLCAGLAFVTSPAAVLGLICALGVGQAVNGAAWSALVPAIVERDRLSSAIGLVQAARTCAGIVAPALGGLLTGLYGARVPLLLDAASFVVVLIAGLAVRTRRAVAHPSSEKQRGGLSIVRSDPLLRSVFLVFPLFVLLGSMVNVVDVFLVRSTLGASATWYGIVGAVYSAGALIGSVASVRFRSPTALAWALVVSAALLATGLIGHGLAPTVGWLLPIGLATGAANGVLSVAVSALVMGTAAPEARGRIGALLTGVLSGTQLVAFGLGGVLAGVLNPRTIFVLAGIASALPTIALGRGILRAARAHEAADSTDMTVIPAAA